VATLNPQSVAAGGTAITYTPATASDTITNAPGTVLRVNNSSGASTTVTMTGQVNCSQGAKHDATFTVAAGAVEDCPVPSHCIDPTTESATVTYSATTSITVAAVKQ